MCPTSVFIPVPVTIAVAFPPVTEVEERIIFFLSPSAVNSSSTTDASFSAFTDSPVREDSSVVRLLDVTRRQSAATRSCRYYKYITGNNVRGRNIKLIAVSEYTGMG